jgi:hypothetical protein
MIRASNGSGGVYIEMTGSIRFLIAGTLLFVLSLGGCAPGPVNVASSTDTPGANASHVPHPVVPFDQAINDAAEQMFQSFRMNGDSGNGPLPFVIDPLIGGATGAQSKSTAYIQGRSWHLSERSTPGFRCNPSLQRRSTASLLCWWVL